MIALGKLGREELSFASDLDVLFVYEGGGDGDPGDLPVIGDWDGNKTSSQGIIRY